MSQYFDPEATCQCCGAPHGRCADRENCPAVGRPEDCHCPVRCAFCKRIVRNDDALIILREKDWAETFTCAECKDQVPPRKRSWEKVGYKGPGAVLV